MDELARRLIGILHALATRVTRKCAAFGEILGSSLLPDVVTRCMGTGRDAYCALSLALTRSMGAMSMGPGLASPELAALQSRMGGRIPLRRVCW